MLIPVRCKVCRRRVLFKASPDTTGTIEAHCKTCNNIVTYKLPLPAKSDGGTSGRD